MPVKEETAPLAVSQQPGPSRTLPASRLTSSGPPSRGSPALASSPPPAPAPSSGETDDLFARAQAMGIRLTRDQYDRTRAGVAAFLKADRVPSSSSSSSSAIASPASGAQPTQPCAAKSTSTPTSSSSSSVPAAAARAQRSHASPPDAVPAQSGSSPGTSTDPQQSSIPTRPHHAVARPGGPLSFFTRVVTPEPAQPQKPRPRLQDVGNAEERKRRKLRRARLRDKLASMSISEPECTPKMSFASPGMSTAAASTATCELARVGLGLSSTATSPATLATSSPRDPCSSASAAIRSRTVSASAIPCSSSTSSSLQGITQDTPSASVSATKRTSPGTRRLTRMAWLSPNGKLSLVPASSFGDSSSSSSLRPFPGDGSPSKNAFLSFRGDDTMDEDDEADILDDGYEGANRAGWGTRSRTESGGSTSNAVQSAAQLPTSAPASGEDGAGKVGLLDKVMADKRSPLRLRAEAKLRDRLQRHSRTLTEAEKTALEVAAANAAPSQETKDGRGSASGPASSSDAPEEASQLMPAPSHDDTARRRRATHTRQHSRSASKNVRWATSVPYQVHERMTTKEHYEYANHGIIPHFMGHSLNDVHLDDPDMDEEPPSSASMPWLFGAHGLDSTPSRLPGSPTGGPGSADSLNIDFSTPLDADGGDASGSGYAMFTARRGLLFGGGSSPLTSPARVPVKRFNANSSDPALSQSPQRGPGGLFMGAGSPTRLTATSRSRHRTNNSIASSREIFGLPLGSKNATLVASPLRSGRKMQTPAASLRLDTISPAAIFGGASVGLGDALAGRAQMNIGSSETTGGAHTQPLPEPTKRWSELPGFDDDEPMTGSEGAKNVNESPARVRAKSTIAQQRLKAATAADTAAASMSISGGTAKVSGQGTMDWGLLSQFSGAGLEMAFSANVDMLRGVEGSNGRPGTSGSFHDAAQLGPATSGSNTQPAPASQSQKRSSPVAPTADSSAMYLDKPDGSRWVKLVSEEMQAAIDSGDLVEPPPRYYVLPPGYGTEMTKPGDKSYAGIIGQAILNSTDQRLSLNEIYNWISTVYPFFTRGDRGWQNSIRHNLSLNKSFIKVEREAHIPGKGGLWTIEPGHEGFFKNGTYSAAPEKAAPTSGAGGNTKKKAGKKTQKAQPRASARRQSAEATPATAMQQLPEDEAVTEQPRKRQTVPQDSFPGQNAGSRSASHHKVVGQGGNTLKKAKTDAEEMEGGHEQENSTSARGPLNSLTNKPLAAQYQQQQQQHHHHQYAASYANAETPIRPGQPYMVSSSHGGSQSGMPLLTDSASSPYTSPMPPSDALMPPPSVGPAFGKRKGGPQQYASTEPFFSMAHGFPGSSEYQNSTATTTVDVNMSTPAHANFFHGGSMYSSQPSPLAERLRGLGGASLTGSPLRRQTLPTSNGGTSGKITSLSPVSSVRGSSLAGAMNMRVGAHAGRRALGMGSGEGADNGGHGDVFSASTAPNPFAAMVSTSRTSPAQSQGAFVQSLPFAQGTGYSPMRGSPLRLSTGDGRALGGPAGGSPQRGGGLASNAAGTALSPAGAELQSALAGAGLGSMGPSIGGLGFGFTSTNITPARITPNSRKVGGMMGPSPSPTIRRLQAQQQGGGWLEDPFDYQGALQHELENMDTTMNGLSGQGGGAAGGSGNGQGAGHSGTTDHGGGSNGMVAGNYNPSPMKYGGVMTTGGAGLGGSWLNGVGHYAGMGNASHHENVSAVRDSVRRGGEGGDGGM